MTPAVPFKLRAIAGLCAAWMVAFAALHAHWAVGGSFALPDGFAVTDHPLLLAIDIAAIPLCLAGAVVAASLVHPIARKRRRTVLTLTIAAGVLCVVHSAPTVISDLGMLVGLLDVPRSAPDRFSNFVYEPWWMLGGVLFLLAAALFRASTRDDVVPAAEEVIADA